MFAFTGLFSRDSRQDIAMSSSSPAASQFASQLDPSSASPQDHVVLKDGRPFAILNATPSLAERTLAQFVRCTPEAQWTLARC